MRCGAPTTRFLVQLPAGRGGNGALGVAPAITTMTDEFEVSGSLLGNHSLYAVRSLAATQASLARQWFTPLCFWAKVIVKKAQPVIAHNLTRSSFEKPALRRPSANPGSERLSVNQSG